MPVESSPDVPTAWVVRTCGPLTISGRVFWLNGGLKMLWAVVNVTGGCWLGRGHRVDVARGQARVAVRQRERVLVGRAVGVLIHRVAGLEHQFRLIRVDRDRPGVQRAAGVVDRSSTMVSV